jgi:hypothetical protein
MPTGHEFITSLRAGNMVAWCRTRKTASGVRTYGGAVLFSTGLAGFRAFLRTFRMGASHLAGRLTWRTFLFSVARFGTLMHTSGIATAANVVAFTVLRLEVRTFTDSNAAARAHILTIMSAFEDGMAFYFTEVLPARYVDVARFCDEMIATRHGSLDRFSACNFGEILSLPTW